MGYGVGEINFLSGRGRQAVPFPDMVIVIPFKRVRGWVYVRFSVVIRIIAASSGVTYNFLGGAGGVVVSRECRSRSSKSIQRAPWLYWLERSSWSRVGERGRPKKRWAISKISPTRCLPAFFMFSPLAFPDLVILV